MQIKINTETIRSGQPAAYMDAKNVVRLTVESDYPVKNKVIRAILMQIMEAVYPPRRGTPIDSTETLKKQPDGSWIFSQHMPFTD